MTTFSLRSHFFVSYVLTAAIGGPIILFEVHFGAVVLSSAPP